MTVSCLNNFWSEDIDDKKVQGRILVRSFMKVLNFHKVIETWFVGLNTHASAREGKLKETKMAA